jgi:hypothetical protein
MLLLLPCIIIINNINTTIYMISKTNTITITTISIFTMVTLIITLYEFNNI